MVASSTCLYCSFVARFLSSVRTKSSPNHERSTNRRVLFKKLSTLGRNAVEFIIVIADFPPGTTHTRYCTVSRIFREWIGKFAATDTETGAKLDLFKALRTNLGPEKHGTCNLDSCWKCFESCCQLIFSIVSVFPIVTMFRLLSSSGFTAGLGWVWGGSGNLGTDFADSPPPCVCSESVVWRCC